MDPYAAGQPQTPPSRCPVSPINIAHKEERRSEAHRAHHEEECVRDEEHIPTEEHSLHKARPLGPRIVPQSVRIHVPGSRPTTQQRSPPPPMVFRRELKVRQRDGHERGHQQQNDVHDGKDRKDRQRLIAPHRLEDIMQLHVDRREGKATSDQHLHGSLAVYRQRGDVTWELGGAAGGLEDHRALEGEPCAEHSEGQRDDGPQEEEYADSAEGEGCSGAIRPGGGVEHGPLGEARAGEEEDGEYNVTHPVVAAHHLVVVRCGVRRAVGHVLAHRLI